MSILATLEETREPRHLDHTLRRPAQAFWGEVERFIDRNAAQVSGLVFHGLGPLAAECLEARGAAAPQALSQRLQSARVVTLAMPFVLERARAACDGPLLVVKGPEVACRYPNAARGYGDIDLLVPDAAKTQRELIASGFVELHDPLGVWSGIHHLPPVQLPGTMLAVEVHSTPKWLEGLQPPSTDELLAAAAPSAVGVQGILAPDPGHHALLLAAHAWAHQPLGRVRDLVDVGAFRCEADPNELERTARRWGLRRLWRTFGDAIDAVLARRSTVPLALWARHLHRLRDQTVLEVHVERLIAPIWGYPKTRAPRLVASALVNELRPAFDEDWNEKIRRTSTALRRPLAAVGEHREMLGDAARRGVRLGATPTDGDATGHAKDGDDATHTAGPPGPDVD
jgi:hypothetical protein